MADAAVAGTRSFMQFLLDGFKQGRRKNWRKASGEKFTMMFGESEIRTIGKKPCHGSFAKWRSGLCTNAVFRQKLRQRNQRVRSGGVLLERARHNPRFYRVRFDIPRARIIHIAERSARQPLAPSQFLAAPSLNVLFEIIAVIFRLAERHLQHKEPLRRRLKPKCRKAQRDNSGGVHGVDDASAVY